MDFFDKPNAPAAAILSLPFSLNVQLPSKTTGWFTQKELEIDPNLPHKVLLKVAHAFLYATLMDFFSWSHLKSCAQLLLSYLLPYPGSIAIQQRLAGYTKRS
jgi:hypothetical protein